MAIQHNQNALPHGRIAKDDAQFLGAIYRPKTPTRFHALRMSVVAVNGTAFLESSQAWP